MCTEYGFFKLALVILMVMLVHFVEAYALNPAIYSAHLKLHPLMVRTLSLTHYTTCHRFATLHGIRRALSTAGLFWQLYIVVRLYRCMVRSQEAGALIV